MNITPDVRLILPLDSSDVLPSLVHFRPIVARTTDSKPRTSAIIIRARQAWMYPEHSGAITHTYPDSGAFTHTYPDTTPGTTAVLRLAVHVYDIIFIYTIQQKICAILLFIDILNKRENMETYF